MSPYQRDVISTTLEGFDRQAQKGLGSIAQNAIRSGAFGGARQGVAEAEYMAQSDRNRAALQAGLLQQGFGQAQQAAQQNFANQMNLAGTVPALQGQRDCWSTNNWFRFTSKKRYYSTTTISTSTINATNTGCTNIWCRRNRFNCWISRPNNKPDDTIT